MSTANDEERYCGVIYRGKAFGRITAEDYDDAIAELREAKTQLEPDGDNCHVCHDSGHQAWECHHNPLAMARQAAHMRHQWRCFHCGDVFTDEKLAAEHFGSRGDEKPAACGAMLNAFAEEFERYGVHRNFHNAASVRLLVVEISRRCAQIASELEDDDCTAGAVWEAIRDQFGLSRAERGVPGPHGGSPHPENC